MNRSNMEVMYGKYQKENTIETKTNTDYQTCKDVCDNNSKCKGFTLSHDGTCELKDSFSNIKDTSGYILYKK